MEDPWATRKNDHGEDPKHHQTIPLSGNMGGVYGNRKTYSAQILLEVCQESTEEGTAENAWDETKVPWASVEALQTMAAQARHPIEWAVLAAAVVSMVAGQRVGEMAGIKVRGLDRMRGTITFWNEKVNRITYSRTLGP